MRRLAEIHSLIQECLGLCQWLRKWHLQAWARMMPSPDTLQEHYPRMGSAKFQKPPSLQKPLLRTLIHQEKRTVVNPAEDRRVAQGEEFLEG